MDYLSEDSSIPAQFDRAGVFFKGVVAHLMDSGELAEARRISRAVVCTSSRNLELDAPYVVTDDRAVGRMAAEYFLMRGYKRFIFTVSDSQTYERLRLEGFRERLEADGVAVQEIKLSLELDAFPVHEIRKQRERLKSRR